MCVQLGGGGEGRVCLAKLVWGDMQKCRSWPRQDATCPPACPLQRANCGGWKETWACMWGAGATFRMPGHTVIQDSQNHPGPCSPLWAVLGCGVGQRIRVSMVLLGGGFAVPSLCPLELPPHRLWQSGPTVTGALSCQNAGDPPQSLVALLPEASLLHAKPWGLLIPGQDRDQLMQLSLPQFATSCHMRSA